MARTRLVLPLLALASVLWLWPSPARAQTPPALTAPVGGHVELTLVLVPAGSFRQGSPPTEKGRGEDEAERDVKMSAFYMGQTPVTRAQYASFVEQTGYRTESEKGTSGGFGWDGHALVQHKEFNWRSPGFAQTDDDPVTLVTYADAEAFASWLGGKLGHAAALPTEAEWEYAARAGTKTPYYGAQTEDQALDLGWFQKNAGSGTRPVGKKKPNAWKLFDMGGDVYEWCRDWYGPYPPGPATDPEATTAPPGDTARRVLRGGSWLKGASAGRSAARYRNTPGSRNADNGFRVVAAVAATPSLGAALAPPGSPSPDPLPTPAPTPFSTPAEQLGLGFGELLLGGGCCLGVGGGGLWAIVALVRSGRRGRGAVQTRIGQDGFWIASGHPAGTRVRYQAMVGGVPVGDVVTLDGGPQGTFVYTGSPPAALRILEVMTVVGAPYQMTSPFQGYRGMGPPNVHPPVRTRAPRGYPSAY